MMRVHGEVCISSWSYLDGILEAGEIAGAALGVVEVGKEDLLLLFGIGGSAQFSRLVKMCF